MVEEPLEQLDAVDFAVIAFHVDGAWDVDELTLDHLVDAPTLVAAMRRLPGEDSVALVAVDEDWFLVARVVEGRVRLLLSDATAAEDWDLAASVLDLLGLPEPEDEDDQVPAGDLGLLTDLGMDAEDLGALIADLDLYPEEILSEVAEEIGFGDDFDDVVGLAPADLA
ncbi:tRNA adenosine deaminase-associated protein [Nocardioides sp. AX2bis]|uniref:tRNA adenosine deaminase-associated protein n=1 Tax=Nocardioides sp. AX2bis TaxID=2653157 RepID=UPI0012F0E890|nr:tRNA adenosine deaminase-associated protein [Nocardioides sp. AX2bis]VXC33082.1 conserved hypothetical protein [Nocardioides sp. AX2bis]